MMTEVLNMLIGMFRDILGIVNDVFVGLNGWDLIIGALIVTTVHRMLLLPLIGGTAANSISDIVAHEKANRADNYKINEVKGKSQKKDKRGNQGNG